MDIVIDTSALLAVIAGKPERNTIIIELTKEHTLIGLAAFPGKNRQCLFSDVQTPKAYPG